MNFPREIIIEKEITLEYSYWYCAAGISKMQYFAFNKCIYPSRCFPCGEFHQIILIGQGAGLCFVSKALGSKFIEILFVVQSGTNMRLWPCVCCVAYVCVSWKIKASYWSKGEYHSMLSFSQKIWIVIPHFIFQIPLNPNALILFPFLQIPNPFLFLWSLSSI